MRWYKWLINFFTAWFRPKKLPNANDRTAARYFAPAPGMCAWLYTGEVGRIEERYYGLVARLERDGFFFALSYDGEIVAYDIEDDETANEFKRQLEHYVGPVKIVECTQPCVHSTLVYGERGCCVLGDGETRGEALLWAMVDAMDLQGKGNDDDRT